LPKKFLQEKYCANCSYANDV